MINCGSPPKVLAVQKLTPIEFMYYLYMPVSMKDSYVIKLPDRLEFMSPLVEQVIKDCEWFSKYMYITVKSMFVDALCPGNRPGWHIDGFQSNGDINYIWFDANPTEFAIQSFVDIPNDDTESMTAIKYQVREECIQQYPENTLLRLDESVVHRVSTKPLSCFRTFIKITVSNHKFINKGNSKNYLIDYDWPIRQRKTTERNLDHG